MSETMMALGAYQDFKRSQSYRWQAQKQLLRRLVLQFIGQGEETIKLSNVIYPHFRGDLKQLDAIRTEAATGLPSLLVDGLGFV